jgi:hypothetical protein
VNVPMGDGPMTDIDKLAQIACEAFHGESTWEHTAAAHNSWRRAVTAVVDALDLPGGALMTDKCELCGGSSHPSPDTQADQFGLVCPGSDADERERDIYLAALTQAYLNLLTTEAENYVNEISRRKELWYQRTRSEVTQEELQADCDNRVTKLHYRGPGEQSEAILVTPDLDIDPPHLTVRGVVPPRRTLIKVFHRDKSQPDDAALWLGTQEESKDRA